MIIGIWNIKLVRSEITTIEFYLLAFAIGNKSEKFFC